LFENNLLSGENYIKRSFLVYAPHQLLFGEQVKKNEMGGACSVVERRGAYKAMMGT